MHLLSTATSLKLTKARVPSSVPAIKLMLLFCLVECEYLVIFIVFKVKIKDDVLTKHHLWNNNWSRLLAGVDNIFFRQLSYAFFLPPQLRQVSSTLKRVPFTKKSPILLPPPGECRFGAPFKFIAEEIQVGFGCRPVIASVKFFFYFWLDTSS